MSLNIRPISEGLAKKAREELNEVPERIPEDLKQIRDWLAKQPHLKVRDDDQFLVNFLRGSKYSLERTKEKLDLFYSIRSSMPEMFVDRDPQLPVNLELIRMGLMLPLPKLLTPDAPRIVLMRAGTYDPSKYTIQEVFRANSYIMDILMYEDDNIVIGGQVGMIDLSKATMAHFVQFSPSMAKKMTLMSQEASPLRLKGFNYIHTPTGFETLFNMFKGFLNEKNRSRLHVHGDNWESLYKQIPKKMLPAEYGGEAGPIQDIIDHWEKKIMSYRDYFLEEAKYGSDESKRLVRSKHMDTIFGTEGSFRKLNVD